jgi:hypothetical protein
VLYLIIEGFRERRKVTALQAVPSEGD